MRDVQYSSVPLQGQQRLLVVSCSVEINGVRTQLLVDTGAMATVLDRGIIDRLQIRRTEKRERAIRGVGKIGAAWLYATRLDSLKIGGVLITKSECRRR